MRPGTVNSKVRIFVKFSAGCGGGERGGGNLLLVGHGGGEQGLRVGAASGGQKLPQTADRESSVRTNWQRDSIVGKRRAR